MNPRFYSFQQSELGAWPMASENFTRLRESVAEGRRVTLTSANSPWRIDKMFVNHRRASVTAKTDAVSISSRPCFLCAANRPANQSSIALGTELEILINPYPLAATHFTIPSTLHEPQTLDPWGKRIREMEHLARVLEGLCVFYNGASCGASAPDHFHFQAVSVDAVPNIMNDVIVGEPLIGNLGATLSVCDPAIVPYLFFIIESSDTNALLDMFRLLWSGLKKLTGDGKEPPVNVAMVHDESKNLTRTLLIPRRCHRPQCYFVENGKLLISPATVEMLGTIICSRIEDFERLDLQTALSILQEVSITQADLEKLLTLMYE